MVEAYPFEIAKDLKIENWQSAHALRDNKTVFYQKFHGIEPVDGYLCLIAYCGNGIKGFLPPSELGLEAPTERDLHRLVRRPVPVRLRDILRDRSIVVFSRRLAVEFLSRRFWEAVRPGLEVEGVVVTPPRPRQPLLLDLGGAVAEVPPDELVWSDWVDPGELAEKYPLYGFARAVVLSADPRSQKVFVSLKALTPDPWQTTVPERYPKGAVRTGVVSGKIPSGVFVRFPDGTSCLCSGANGARPGEEVLVKIKKVDAARRRLSGRIIHERDGG